MLRFSLSCPNHVIHLPHLTSCYVSLYPVSTILFTYHTWLHAMFLFVLSQPFYSLTTLDFMLRFSLSCLNHFIHLPHLTSCYGSLYPVPTTLFTYHTWLHATVLFILSQPFYSLTTLDFMLRFSLSCPNHVIHLPHLTSCYGSLYPVSTILFTYHTWLHATVLLVLCQPRYSLTTLDFMLGFSLSCLSHFIHLPHLTSCYGSLYPVPTTLFTYQTWLHATVLLVLCQPRYSLTTLDFMLRFSLSCLNHFIHLPHLTSCYGSLYPVPTTLFTYHTWLHATVLFILSQPRYSLTTLDFMLRFSLSCLNHFIHLPHLTSCYGSLCHVSAILFTYHTWLHAMFLFILSQPRYSLTTLDFMLRFSLSCLNHFIHLPHLTSCYGFLCPV